MEYTKIEDIQKGFDNLMSWEKAEFINTNLKYADAGDLIEYCSCEGYDEAYDYDEILLDEEKLEKIPIETIRKYLEEYDKENGSKSNK